MIKTIEVAGISLDNYTVREAIMNIEKRLDDHGFHIIEEVNMDMLMMAETDEAVRGALEAAEITVIAEAKILEVVKASNYQRKHEIEHHDFFREMMKRIERNHKALFIVGDEAKQLEQMKKRVEELYPRCKIIGVEALEECGGATDNIVNLINSLAPDVILSIVPHPKQEHFLMQYHDKLSTELWYGIGEVKLDTQKKRFRDILRGFIRARKFEKQVEHYKDNSDPEAYKS
jgi:N-acetylglucosaminyldiphosphoundecaprenol N-acetyl-beta-D-mannosaminyltransferase